MPNVHRVKHEVKYSNGTFEIPIPEERDRQDKTFTRVGFTVRSCLLSLAWPDRYIFTGCLLLSV